MAVYVNTNFSALMGQRSLNNVNTQLTTTYQRLSSGLRINSAKDDAAGLQISDRLTSQINGLNQGNRNASDGIALLQTVDGAAEEIIGAMQRIRTLAVQAANGTNSTEDRQALTTEAQSQLTAAMAHATDTTFGGYKIMLGYFHNGGDCMFDKSTTANTNFQPGKMTLQVGANKGDTIDAVISNFFVADIAKNIKVPGSTKSIETVSDGGLKVIMNGADVGTMQIDLTAFSKASGTIQAVDAIIGELDARRADVGAYMNRLESSIRNQSNVSANEADARSRIRDADFAEESANLSQQNIIQQAASSMLMQANTRPQLGLQLLR